MAVALPPHPTPRTPYPTPHTTHPIPQAPTVTLTRQPEDAGICTCAGPPRGNARQCSAHHPITHLLAYSADYSLTLLLLLLPLPTHSPTYHLLCPLPTTHAFSVPPTHSPTTYTYLLPTHPLTYYLHLPTTYTCLLPTHSLTYYLHPPTSHPLTPTHTFLLRPTPHPPPVHPKLSYLLAHLATLRTLQPQMLLHLARHRCKLAPPALARGTRFRGRAPRCAHARACNPSGSIVIEHATLPV